MKYISPNDNNHTITLEPRFYPSNETASIEIIDYNSKSTTAAGVTTTVAGVTTVDFSLNSENGDIFTIIISDDNDEVFYMGSLKSVDNE